MINMSNNNSIHSDCILSRPNQAFDLPIQVIIALIFTITSLVSLLGNLTVLIVAWKGTSTALVMKKFSVNLAIADLLTGVFCVPFSYTENMLNQWIFPDTLCPIIQFISYISVFITAWTLVIIGIER